MPQTIEIFRAGRHLSMSGESIEFSEADLAATAEAYDPKLHEAPIVVGHPHHDAPAYGWVGALHHREGALEAEPVQVDAAFAEMVRKGRFKKVSASFYPPFHAGNPKPGVYYLRHVGFLGAQPPAVKGLRTVEFAADEAGIVTVEFGERERWGFEAIARLLRRLRERWIEKEGVQAADDLLPEYLIDDVAAAARPPESPEEKTMPEPQNPTPQNAAFAERQAALDRKEQELLALERRLAEQAEQARRAEIAEFAERLAAEGRILPRQRPGIEAVLAAVDAEQPLEFGEGDEQYTGTAGAWLREFLASLPPRVEFAELSPPGTETPVPGITAPSGYSVDPERAELHRKILAYAEQHDVDYATAALAVGE